MPLRSIMEAGRKSAHPAVDLDQYPANWSEYIGQEAAKRNLQIAIKSAKMRNQPLKHVLIAHPSPGVGKTALAALIGREMGTTVRVVSGQIDVAKARMLFSVLKDNDVLFYDEFHQVMDAGRKKAEWMLDYLQDNTLPGPRGAEKQPRVTIVAATTDPGKIPDTIVGRFGLPLPMSDYTDEEATRIVQAIAKKVLVPEGLPVPNDMDAAAIAVAASNNPRAIRRLLSVLLDMTITEELALTDGCYDVPGLLEFQGITPDGLDLAAQTYLATLAVEFDGSAGAKAMEDRLQQAGGLGTVERVLMDKGYIVKTRTGRTLTQDGITRFHELAS